MVVIKAETNHTTDMPVGQSLDRETRITLMNASNIAGELSTGDSASYEKNLRLVIASHKKLGLL